MDCLSICLTLALKKFKPPHPSLQLPQYYFKEFYFFYKRNEELINVKGRTLLKAYLILTKSKVMNKRLITLSIGVVIIFSFGFPLFVSAGRLKWSAPIGKFLNGNLPAETLGMERT